MVRLLKAAARDCPWKGAVAEMDLARARKAVRCAGRGGCRNCAACGDFAQVVFYHDAVLRLNAVARGPSVFRNPLLSV